MSVLDLNQRIKQYQYYYTTKNPTLGNSHVIHKKGCESLTEEILDRVFIGFEFSPADAFTRANKEDNKNSYLLCEKCCDKN